GFRAASSIGTFMGESIVITLAMGQDARRSFFLGKKKEPKEEPILAKPICRFSLVLSFLAKGLST
ncbi:MAG: hypothetical protein NTU83_04685, partial [Candidatus Hydrogenedentes bacterium]|nr:hypothetical protein [Candidatus Hydrogenedentota bacterium]